MDIFDIDWDTVEPGTRFVAGGSLHAKPQKAVDTWPRRTDGLWELVFERVKDGVPVFHHPEQRKLKAFGYHMAVANDQTKVEELIQTTERERLRQEARREASELKRQQEKEVRDAARKKKIAEREETIQQLAVEHDVSIEGIKDGMRIWNRIRDVQYPVSRCFLCGRNLTDPHSIAIGVGTECIKDLPGLKIAMKDHLASIGLKRYDAERLLTRFRKAGASEIVKLLEDHVATEMMEGCK